MIDKLRTSITFRVIAGHQTDAEVIAEGMAESAGYTLSRLVLVRSDFVRPLDLPWGEWDITFRFKDGMAS